MKNKIEDLDVFLSGKKGEFHSDELYYVKTEQALKYIKRVRNRKKSLSRNVNKCKTFPRYIDTFFTHFEGKVHVSGAENYDFLKKSLLDEGWREDFPLLLCYSEKRDKWRVKQGHHRIDIAKDIGMEYIPVLFNISNYP